MKHITGFICIVCMLLCICGCTETAKTAAPVADAEPAADTTAADTVSAAETAVVVWPDAEKIRATIAAEDAEVYWLAEGVSAPEHVTCYSVSELDLAAFWDELSQKLPTAAGQITSGTLSVSGGAEQIQTILDALQEATGTAFTEVSLADDDAACQCCYAQTIDGLHLDTEGYVADKTSVIPGSLVAVYEDGRVSVQTPLCPGQTFRTLERTELISPEEAQTLCTFYYQSYGLPCVTVVTGLELVYYHVDGELRPAWRFDETWYPSENGHLKSQMIDAQTGEYLRQ